MNNNYQKEEERNADLHLRLSEKYMTYKDLADRCLISSNQVEKGENRVFYMQPNSPFLKEPRTQNVYRNEFIRSIGQPPTPEPITLLADDLHKQFIETVGDKSNPSTVKEELYKFFKRRQYKLQHKRYKLLVRWAHHCMTSEKIDKQSIKFNPAMAKIQFELENSIKRHQRLEGIDHFLTCERPEQKEGSSYTDDGERAPVSAIRVDDIDVYFRVVTYEERATRNTEKFIQRVKYAPLSHRFEIYSESIHYFQNMRNSSIQKQKNEMDEIQKKGDYLIELKKLGDEGAKELTQIIQSKSAYKQEQKLQNNKDIYMSKCKYNYEMPPMIQWNEVELKIRLQELSVIYKITGDMDKDNGHNFSFQVVTYFPNIFQLQVVKNQFAPYDAIPNLIDPKNLGKNIKKVIKRSQKKYGRTQGANTLLEKLEIEKHSKEMGIEFINSVENSLFGKFNAGQIDNFPSVRLKKSDWIEHICFKPEIDNDQMFQAAILSGENNWIDECLANFLEILNVNDLPNINLILESISQIHYDKTKFGQIKTDFLNFNPNEHDTFFTESQKSFLSLFNGCLKSKADFDLTKQSQEIGQKSLHQIPSHLLLSTYLLQCLKAREEKTKLLYTLNTFRSIQRRITIELREMGTRDRVLGDALFVVPKEQQSESKISDSDTNNSKDSYDTFGDGKDDMIIYKDSLIDINKYRFQGQMQNYLNSTCPIVPKFHATFGQPIERQDISKEMDLALKESDIRRATGMKFIGRIDTIYKNEEQKLNLVKDDFGIHVIYEASFEDMRLMEQEIIKICSFYINKAEPLLDNDLKNIYPCVDRLRILEDAIRYENEYLEHKLALISVYLECYDHITDILEQQRIIQVIVDEMARRPRFNLSGTYFKDSYNAEFECLKMKTSLLRQVMNQIIKDEKKVNNSTREYIEKAYRLLHEHINGKFSYVQPEELENEINKREITQTGKGGTRDSKNDKLLDSEIQTGRKVKVDEVELEIRRHKANQLASKIQSLNFSDAKNFAASIGVPFSDLELIMRNHQERDQLVGATVHENVAFIKMVEGYPNYFIKNSKSLTTIKLQRNSEPIEIVDFYEGLQIFPKVISSIQRALKELNDCHKPDNGLTSTSLEIKMYEFLKAEFEVVKNQDSLILENRKGINYIEDDTISGNSDYLLFIAKELASSKDDPLKSQNPFVIAKLDIPSVKYFDFLPYQGYIDQTDLVGQKQNKKDENADARITKKNFGNFYQKVNSRTSDLNMPSMLVLSCNSYEILRLRNALIYTLEQAQILENVYEKQMQIMGKEGRVSFKDPFNFQNYVVNNGENFIDFVEDGPGDEIQINIAINEFDPKLRSSLNFMDPECVKSMMLPMGLEELRQIVQYELMNLQALIVGTRTNQILLDNSLRKLNEIQFFEKGFTVANPVFNLLEKLQSRANFSDQNLRKLPGIEKSELVSQIQSSIGENFYNIILRKQKMKEQVEKQFKLIKNSSLILKEQKIEITQKQLRVTKLVLCNDYCQDILARVYCDSVKLQILYETDNLRKRAYLLPRDSIFLEIIDFKSGEHQFANYNEDCNSGQQNLKPLFYDKNTNKILSFWRIPSFKEIVELDWDIDHFKKINMPKNMVYDVGNISEQILPEFMCEDILSKIKSKIPSITYIANSRDVDTVLKEKNRLVEFTQAYDYIQSGKALQYLTYFKSISNIYDLEFFTNKLASSANSMCNLEKSVLSGVPFWEEGDDSLFDDADDQQSDEEDQKQSHDKLSKKNLKKQDNEKFPKGGHRPLQNILAKKVTEKVAQEKRQKVQLIQDLESIKDLFIEYDQIFKKQEIQGNIQRAANLLQDFYQIKFYGVLQILYQMQDNYFKDKKGQKEILFINEIIQKLSHQNDMKITYNNGFHVNYAITSTDRVFIDANTFNPDYDSFFKATQYVIDEEALNPPEINLVQSIYLTNSINLVTFKKNFSYVGAFPQRDYACLDFAMTNLSKEIRRYFMQNINSNEQILSNFIKAFSKLNEKEYQSNPTIYAQILQDKKQFLKIQIKARQSKRIFMIIQSKKTIPLDVEEYNRLYSMYYDDMLWKINSHMDGVQKNRAQAAERDISSMKRKNMAGAVQSVMTQNQDSTVLKMFDQASSEIEVIQNELQKYMIKMSCSMFERETQSLAKTFEMTDIKVQAFIHPCQQYASTFHQKFDNRNHLDIINKVGAIQKMLTQIKNRCLEIQTLTSGVGVVISQKDLTECLEECCRALMKHGEIEMRTRCEHLYNQIIQYENLIYIKDQQLINLENKLKISKQEINKIVNTKVFSRGNNLVYELDMSNRQLRFLKDNIYLMEKNLTEKIQLCYDKELDMTRMKLNDVRMGLKEYQDSVNEKVKANVREKINTIDAIMKQKANTYKDLSIPTQIQKKYEEMKQKSSNTVQNTTINIENLVINKNGQASIAGQADPKLLEELDEVKTNEKEAREQVLRLQDTIRKYRIMNKLKEVLTAERHQFKIDNLKSQLTSNTTLWEQLAESEKREIILKQEIERAQQEIATQEKIIERLKDDIKKETLEKQKLLQYKITKSKRLDELESKAREFEVLSSVNLDKILSLLESKEKKINDLQKSEDNIGDYVNAITKLNRQEMQQVKKRAQEETNYKIEAMNKLESLRQELQMIQGSDQVSVSFWKEQCQSLFLICKNLKEDNEKLVKSIANSTTSPFLGKTNIQTLDQFSNNNDLMNYLNQTPKQNFPDENVRLSIGSQIKRGAHRRGYTQQQNDFNTINPSLTKQKEQYERDLYGFDRNLQNHMLGPIKSRQNQNLIAGQSFNSFISDPMDTSIPSTRISLPKINFNAQKQIGALFVNDSILRGSYGGQANNIRMIGQPNPFANKPNMGQNVFGLPQNLFANLSNSVHINDTPSDFNKYQSNDMLGTSIDRSTINTHNNSISLNQASYDPQQQSLDIQRGLDSSQIAQIPLTQRNPAGINVIQNFAEIQNHGISYQGIDKIGKIEDQLKLQTIVPQKLIEPSSKLVKTLDNQGIKGGQIKKKSQFQ